MDPWGGETARSNNQAFQPHRYTTYERDSNGGDEAMMRRYAGKWHRFVQPDPYEGSYDLTDPQSFNRYAYVQNDPVSLIDPTGLDELEWAAFNCQTRADLGVGALDWMFGWQGPCPGGGVGAGDHGGAGPGGPGPTVEPPEKPTPTPCPPVPQGPSGANVDDNIREAAASFKDALEPKWYAGPDSGEDPLGKLAGHAMWFYKQVKDRGPWDYKYRDPKIDEGRGSIYESFGNFNYGAAGAAAGFSEGQLLRLAGHYQTEGARSEGENPGLIRSLLGYGGKAPYGDDPADQQQIKNGINYYHRKFVLKDCQ